MKTLLITGIIILGLFTSNYCKYNEYCEDINYDICGENDPTWFMELLDEVEKNPQCYFGSVIYRYEYNSDYYFLLEIPISSCSDCRTYDCYGNLIEWSSQIDFQNYFNNRTDKTIIWKWEE